MQHHVAVHIVTNIQRNLFYASPEGGMLSRNTTTYFENYLTSPKHYYLPDLT
jgi:hypothetical protein